MAFRVDRELAARSFDARRKIGERPDHNSIVITTLARPTDYQSTPLRNGPAFPNAQAYPDRLVAHATLIIRHYCLRCSATIAARTASNGELIRAVCSTTTNRRFVLPSIGEDQA